MKAILPIGFFAVAAVFLATSNAHALQVTYSVVQTGASGNFNFGAGVSQPNFLNQFESTEVSQFQLTGSVNPDRVGLIGASSGFRASALLEFPGDFPEPEIEQGPVDGGVLPDDDFGPPGGDEFGWDSITIDTSAVGRFETTAQINGLTDINNVGFIQFDWAVTGISSILVDVEQEFGDANVVEAVSIARLESTTETADSFIHAPAVGADGSVNDTIPGLLELESFIVPFDQIQLDSGEVPSFVVDFEFAVETRLNVTSSGEGGFTSIFDANFSNTATLTNVTVLDNAQLPIEGASVVDAFTGNSIVASTVPEPSAALVVLLAGCAGAIGRRRAS